jgi:2,4-dienoyl-CoA reductase-like NADH-dependent reductase (Old Yellow Enzyme family)
MGTSVDFTEDTHILTTPVIAGELTFPNRMAIQPMEGADADIDGAPTAHTRERYLRYARGCAGLIWIEACAVDVPEARSHNKMLVISDKTLPALRSLVEEIKKESESSLSGLGIDGRASLVLQLSHAGRYRVIKSDKSPAIAYRFPELDRAFGVTESVGKVISDTELEDLRDEYVKASSLALKAGFDAVDVKTCHAYLLHDLLTAYERPGGYGGKSFEARTRFFLETIDAVREDIGCPVTSRISPYDGFPAPYGFGSRMDPYPEYTPYGKMSRFDPTESVRLIKEMKSRGVDFVNVSLGNPYYSQFLTRPFDAKMPGQREAPEHPMLSVGRHFEIVETLKREVKDMVFVGSGYSWLRQYGINAAAYNVENSRTDVAGWGRLAFSYPDFPKTVISGGLIPKSKVCTTCSGCSRLLRGELRTGCVVQYPGTFRESLRKVKERGL